MSELEIDWSGGNLVPVAAEDDLGVGALGVREVEQADGVVVAGSGGALREKVVANGGGVLGPDALAGDLGGAEASLQSGASRGADGASPGGMLASGFGGWELRLRACCRFPWSHERR